MKQPASEVDRLMRLEQPINWGRAFVSGLLGASLVMAIVDIFNLLGFTPLHV